MKTSILPNNSQELTYFENLFSKYYTSLCTYAYRYINDRYAAEDVVQDVFAELWQKKDKIDFSIPISSYLYKITYNKSIDYLRHVRLVEEKLSMVNVNSFLNHYLTNSYMEQDEFVHLNEITKEINICIRQLPPQCQKIFQLSREENLKNREIAYLLKISIKAVEKQISKALNEIKEHLKKHHLLSSFLIITSCFLQFA